MQVHMYDDVTNFGDVLNKYIWHPYLGDVMNRNDDILMFGIGTLLGDKTDHQGSVIVCGTGCGYQPNLENIDKENWNIFFVRGPLTARALDLPPEIAITDPAILTPEIFSKAEPSGRVVFVPHWETSFNPLWKSACERAGIDYIDPLSNLESVIKAISGAKLVIAEAMHAAILADAYRVPWLPVSTSARINKFKWADWGNSLEIEPDLYNLPQLGASDFFRNLTGDNKAAIILAKQTRNSVSKFYQGGSVLNKIANFMYHTLTTWKFRCRLEYYAITKLGRRIDTWVARHQSSKILSTMIDHAAQDLQVLSKKSGTLSRSEVSESKKIAVKMRLASVKEYLNTLARAPDSSQARVKSVA